MSEEVKGLQAVKQSPWLRRAEMMQWFGLVMFVLAIGLAALTDFMARREGSVTIVLFMVLGLLAMLVARLILAVFTPRHP